MLAAGPALLTALCRVACMTRPDSPVHEIAVQATEAHLEREGMQLDDVASWETPGSGDVNDDPAAEFRAMFVAHCEACERAGSPVPTVDEWVEIVDRTSQEDAD